MDEGNRKEKQKKGQFCPYESAFCIQKNIVNSKDWLVKDIAQIASKYGWKMFLCNQEE